MLQQRIFRLFILRVLVVGAFFGALWHSREIDLPPTTVSIEHFTQTYDAAQQQPLYETGFIDTPGINSVHSATLAQARDDQLIAFWFGGSREGASDVAVYQSYYTTGESGGSWTTPRVAFTRKTLSRQLDRYIAKLGNPVAFLDASDRLWLFLVSVSIGGWSGSAVNYTISTDYGRHWSKIRRLNTSALFNLGTLVRNPPVQLADGGILLPVYHETITKFSQVLWLDTQGRLLANRKIGGVQSMQASLCPADSQHIYALARNVQQRPHGRRVLVSNSIDAGTNWSEMTPTNLANPNAAIVCLQTDSDQWILIGNRSETDRSRLSLAVSQSPTTQWRWLYDFDQGDQQRFSYPALIRDNAGEFHLLYSWNRQRIKHVRFNRSWLRNIVATKGE